MSLFGATVAKSPTKETNTDGGRVIGSNSQVFTAGDPVTIDAQGYLAVQTAVTTTSPVYGVVLTTQTMSATNVSTVPPVKPICFTVEQEYEFLMGTNADLTGSNIGVYYKLTGATGAVQVDVTSGAQTSTSRVVVCTEVDPNALGGTGANSGARQGLFKFVKVFDIRDN